MYEEISAKKKKAADNRKLVVWVSLCVFILILVTTLLIGGYLYYSSFRGFVGEFSKTTSIAYRKGAVQVTTQTEKFYLTEENVYYVYNSVVNAGRGRLGEAPQWEPDAVLRYPYGETLELWTVKLDLDTSRREYGLFLRFTNVIGETYAYDTDRLALDMLPLNAKENEDSTGEN